MQRMKVIATILGLTLLAGCARTVISEPLDTRPQPENPAVELAFWHSLPSRSAVSNDEGLHGLLLLADGEDPCATYEERLSVAKKRNWVGEGFDEAGNLAMQRGTLSRAVVVICEIKGGVIMQLTGPNARYATRELAALGMIPEGSSENQTITGLEFMSVVTRAQDRLTMNTRKNQPQVEPGPESPEGAAMPVSPAPAVAPTGTQPAAPEGATPAAPVTPVAPEVQKMKPVQPSGG